MSGAGLEKIVRPTGRYDLIHHPNFPSYRSQLARDRRMAEKMVQAARAASSPKLRAQLEQLADVLNYQQRADPPPATRASFIGAGRLQHRVGSDLNRLATESQEAGDKVAFATLAFRGGAIRPEDLGGVDPRRWQKQLNTDLDRVRRRKGITGAGWSIGVLDGDYLQIEGVCLSHWHLLATGSEIQAIHHLSKEIRKYHSPRQGPEEIREIVRARKHRTHRPLYDIGGLCLYLFKVEWPSQPAPRNVAGNRQRSYPRPLPAQIRPYERLFFGRWPIADTSVLRGLRVVGGHLCPTQKGVGE